MHLFGVEGGLEATAILDDVFTRIPFHKAKVEHFFGVERAEATGAGAEAVNEPGEFSEWREFQDLQAAGFTKAPGCGDVGFGIGGLLVFTRGTLPGR